MSDDEARVPADDTHVPADEPDEPTLLPEVPVGSARAPIASPGQPLDSARPPRVWTVWVVFVASLVVNLVGVVALLTMLAIWEHGPGALSSPRGGEILLEVSVSLVGLLTTVSWSMVVFVGTAITAAALSPVPWRERLRLRPARISAFGMLVHVCGVLAIGLVFGALLTLGALPESPNLAELTRIVTGLSGAGLAATVLVIGIAPGIAEELLFRGYIQTRFSRRWGPGWGVLWTSLLFGLMHMEPVHGMFAFALGIYLGYLTERTGSIVPAMICHAANNTYSTLTTAWGLDVEGVPANVAALVVGLLILCLSVWHLGTLVKPNGRDT